MRQARREGKVPGIVYGDGKEPSPIQIEFNSLLTKLRAGRFMSTLWNLKVDGQDDVRVVCRGVQRDVVKDLPTHIDFMRLHRNNPGLQLDALAAPWVAPVLRRMPQISEIIDIVIIAGSMSGNVMRRKR